MPSVRVDVHAAAGSYPVLLGSGLTDRLGEILDDHSVGRRRFVVTNPVVWRFHGERIAQALPAAELIQVPDGERHKHLGVGRADLRRAGARARRPRLRRGGRRRRRHRRHGGVRRRDVPARHRGGPGADDAAGAGRCVDWRQGGGEPPVRQEPRRLVPPAAPGRHRSAGAAHAVAARVPRGALRGRQVRHGLQRLPVRAAAGGVQAAGRPGVRCAWIDHRGVLPDQGCGGVGGRARGGPAPRAELRPHGRARHRVDHRLPALPPRRGRRVGHAGRRSTGRDARHAPPRRGRGARVARDDARPASPHRRPPGVPADRGHAPRQEGGGRGAARRAADGHRHEHHR